MVLILFILCRGHHSITMLNATECREERELNEKERQEAEEQAKKKQDAPETVRTTKKLDITLP